MSTIYYTAPYIPREWIEAHGFDAQWLDVRADVSWEKPDRLGMVESFRGVCPFAREMQHAVLAACQTGRVVLGTHCDQMRRLGELLAMREDVGRSSLFLFQMPATWQTEAARQHYRDELARLSRFLTMPSSDSPGAMPTTARSLGMRSVIDCGSRDMSNDLAVVDMAPKVGVSKISTTRPRIALLEGHGLVMSPSLVELIERSGGQVVLDATEHGERTRPAASGAMPTTARSLGMRNAMDRSNRDMSNDLTVVDMAPELEALTRAYFDTIVDCYRRPNTRLYAWLKRRMAEEQVQGLILHRYVWCDLWHAEVARLKRWSGVPVLDLDDDGQWSSSLQTRLEAFLESVS